MSSTPHSAVLRNMSIYRHYGFETGYAYTVDTSLTIAFMHRSSVLISALCGQISGRRIQSEVDACSCFCCKHVFNFDFDFGSDV